jgi:HEAT repeat protein
VRLTLVNLLARHKADAAPAVSRLALLLRGDPDQDVRIAAAEALTAIGPAAKTARPELLKAIKDDKPDIRAAAVRALAAIRESKEVILSTFLDLRDDRESSVRREVMLALGAFTTEPKVRQALAVAVVDASEAVREAAVQSLADLPHNRASAFADALGHHDPVIRRSAAFYLTRCGSAASSATAALIRALNDGDVDVRRMSARTLGNVRGDEAVTSGLLECLRQDTETDVRVEAAISLGRIKAASGEVITSLREVARRNRSESLRVAATAALIDINLESVPTR